MKALAPAFLLSWGVACQSDSVRAPFTYFDDIGVAVQKSGQSCVYLMNAALASGQRVQFVTSSTPQTSGELEIIEKTDTCRETPQDLPGASSYSFKVVRGELPAAAPAFAIANFAAPITAANEGVSANLERDGSRDFFRTCTSSEGVHLSVWKGMPLKGTRKWHSYYYLGYDVTPNCTDKEL